MVKRINELIKDIDRNGLLTRIGKPEPLKHRKACSRRIPDEHRLIYNMDNTCLLYTSFISCWLLFFVFQYSRHGKA